MQKAQGMKAIELKPQEGAQEKFLSTEADIAFYGGAAGAGKSFALLLEALRNTDNPDFGAVIFRRTTPQIKNEGGLFDESAKVYPLVGAVPNLSELYWKFPSSATVAFAGMEHEKNIFDWQGSQICMIGFDEITHFTKRQFFYMLSRNRSTCGVKPYIRGTTNPDKKSWVRKFIDWWIDPKTGLPIPARSGVIRFFIVENDEVIWKDSRDEFDDPTQAKSFTFISATIYDNKILLKNDPSYLANLKALPKVDRERLLGGNWDAEEAKGEVFKRRWFPMCAPPAPRDIEKLIRYWDRAASESDTADYTVGLKLAKLRNGAFVILHVERFRGTPSKVETTIKNYAAQDGKNCTVGIERDAGQAGKMEAEYLVKQLAGFSAKINPVSENKVIRAKPASSQAEIGNILVCEGKWNDDFFAELEAFPEGGHDDQVDALSGAFNLLTTAGVGNFTNDMATSNQSGFGAIAEF